MRRLPLSVRQKLHAASQVVRRPASLGDAFIVRRDRRRFAKGHSFLRGPGRRDRPRALVASLSAWPYQLKLEGMLLKALELEGLRPTVLTGRSVRGIASGYYETFGFEVVELEDFADRVSSRRPGRTRPR